MYNYFDDHGIVLPQNSTVDLLFFHRVGIDLTSLEATIPEEEVWDTIKGMTVDRAPRPNGFTGKFYEACWQIIKSDFMAAITIIACLCSKLLSSSISRRNQVISLN
jgi:hypothetical protein